MGTKAASRSSSSTGSAPAGAVATSAALLLLGFSAVVAGFGVLSPLAHWVISPVHLPPPLPSQNQDAENFLFLATFAILVPLAAIAAPRALDPSSRRFGEQRATTAALVLSIALIVLLIAVKLGERATSLSRPGLLLAVSLVWWALAAAVLAGPLRERADLVPARVRPWLWPALALSLAALALCFARLGSIAVAPLAVGLLLAAAVGYIVAVRPRTIDVPPALRWATDVVAVVLLMLAVPNLEPFHLGDLSADFNNKIIQFHQDFFLGPANQLLGGETMLVDVVSQYGVGSILFLAGVFQVAPISNGSLTLTEGLLAAGMFSLAYVSLRLAGVRLVLAWAALITAVVVLVFNLVFPLGGLLQHGAFRFGMPMLIVAAAAGESRAGGRGAAVLRGVEVVVLGLASLWALEAFLYSLGALAGLTAFRAVTAPQRRLGVAGRVAIEALAACVAVHLLFAVGTLIGSGELPHWGKYIDTLSAFLTGKIGELTYDFSPWSPGLAVGALYAGSALGLVAVIRRNRDLAEANRPALLVLSALTGYAIALFSYFVNRSADHILPYVSLPAVMIVALWLELMLRDERVPRPGRALAVGSATAAAALLIAIAWSSAGTRFSQSALAYAAPGGRSLTDAVDLLVHTPPLTPQSADAQGLLETYMPHEHDSVVLTSADLSVETLMRTHRVSEIPLSDPWEDTFVAQLHEDNVKAAVAELQPGRRILIDRYARALLKGKQATAPTIVPTGITALQALALQEIAHRFRLEPIARSQSGVEVVELRRR